MLLDPQISPANPRLRDIQNIVGHKGNFLRHAILQGLIRIDSAYYRFHPPSIANQDHAIPLSVICKSTAVKNRLYRGHLPFKFNDARVFYLAAYIYPSRCKLANGYNDLRISQPFGTLRRDFFAQLFGSETRSPDGADAVQSDVSVRANGNGCLRILFWMVGETDHDCVIRNHFVGPLGRRRVVNRFSAELFRIDFRNVGDRVAACDDYQKSDEQKVWPIDD